MRNLDIGGRQSDRRRRAAVVDALVRVTEIWSSEEIASVRPSFGRTIGKKEGMRRDRNQGSAIHSFHGRVRPDRMSASEGVMEKETY